MGLYCNHSPALSPIKISPFSKTGKALTSNSVIRKPNLLCFNVFRIIATEYIAIASRSSLVVLFLRKHGILPINS